MITMKVEITRGKKIGKLLQGAPRVFRKVINRRFAEMGRGVKKRIRSETPFRTGHLRSQNRLRTGNMTFEIYNEAFYAPFVHEGTRYQPPNRFIDRGLHKSGDAIDRMLMQMLDEIAEEMLRGA